MQEYLDILDERGYKTGEKKLRSKVHVDGDWHKAVHIWLLNPQGELLLQKKSPKKIMYPNMWDVSVGGHVSAGDESVDSAIRETKEEIGLNIKEDDLQLLGTVKNVQMPKSFIDNEINDVYLIIKNVKIKDLLLQEEELADAKFIGISELKREVYNKEFVPHPEEYMLLFEKLNEIL